MWSEMQPTRMRSDWTLKNLQKSKKNVENSESWKFEILWVLSNYSDKSEVKKTILVYVRWDLTHTR